MLDKKLICCIILSGVAFIIGKKSWNRLKSYQNILKYARSADIVFSVAEARELLKQFPNQEYLYLQGYALPNVESQTRFIYLDSSAYLNRITKQQQRVKSFQLMDHITKSDIMEIKLEPNAFLSNTLIDYVRTQRFQQIKMKFVQKILSKIPFLNRVSHTQIIEKQQGIQFGQPIILLGERKDEQFSAKYVTNQSQQEIWLQLSKDFRTKELLAIVGFILSIFLQLPAICGFIHYFYRKLNHSGRESQHLPAPQLEKSVSLLLNSSNDADICVVCLSRVRSIIFEPCLHLVVCQECVDHLQNQTCPLCRLRIDKKIKVIYQQ